MAIFNLTERDQTTVTSIQLDYPRTEGETSAPEAQPGELSRVAAAEHPRRWLNVTVAAVGLILTAPIFVIVALLVKFTSRGPILYTQTRIGLDRRLPRSTSPNHRRRVDCGGKPFRIYKFRTMFVNRRGSTWAHPKDPRVTPVGRWLRKLRLDELPQLLNVLRGDMNIVGPRPEQPKIFNELRAQIPDYSGRQLVRPGITGWAQINLAYDQTIDDVRRKVEYDLEYIQQQSFMVDVKIMLRTIPVIIWKRGAW